MIRETLKHTITLNYGDVTDIAPDVRLTFYNSGHILGSACAHFHIGEGLYNVAFTGDFKYEKTRLFDAAVNQFPRIETVIMEATYGGMHDMQPQRKEAEIELQQICKDDSVAGRQGAHTHVRRGQEPGSHDRARRSHQERVDSQRAGLP